MKTENLMGKLFLVLYGNLFAYFIGLSSSPAMFSSVLEDLKILFVFVVFVVSSGFLADRLIKNKGEDENICSMGMIVLLVSAPGFIFGIVTR